MAKDARERIEDADPLPPREAGEGDDPEGEEREVEYQRAMRDYAPTQALNRQGQFLLSAQDLITLGLSDAEIIKLQREGSAARNGGLSEYDEEQEHLALENKRAQANSLAILDAGDSVRVQLSAMEAYFSGQVPNAHGKYCKRRAYVSPENDIVGINGYVFQIPRYQRVMLPEEVLIQLQAKAMAMEKYDVVSAVYAARQYAPVVGGDPESFAAQVRANHHVRSELIPDNELRAPR